MLKPYIELRKVDVEKFCEEREVLGDNNKKVKIKYLNWAKCIDLLHQHGAEKVYFVPITNETGSSLFMTHEVFEDSKNNKNRCYETRIEIHIDDDVYIMHSPVMNGANPVKDNSMSQQRIWNSMCRSFVKGVAIYTGLGFDLWLKEEDNTSKIETGYAKEDIHHDIMSIRDRVFEKLTALNKKDMSLADIAQKLGKTEEELKIYTSQYKVLFAFENNLDQLLKS